LAYGFLLPGEFMQIGFMAEPFFRSTQRELGKMFGHTRELETIQDGFELLMTIG